MKTPYEIKRGLKCCAYATCNGCPYAEDGCATNREMIDALEYIQQLENQIGELTEMVARLEAAQPKWISVNNPPTEGGRYMILFKDGHCCDAVFDNSIDDGGKFGEWEDIYDTTVHAFMVTEWREYESVTHWMELPKKLKEDV